MSKEYGEENDWHEFNCEKCWEAVFLNEDYIGLVLCENCINEEFPEDDDT